MVTRRQLQLAQAVSQNVHYRMNPTTILRLVQGRRDLQL